MSSYVLFPVAALRTMKPHQVVAMIRLMSHQDLAGHCWPTQTTLAEGTTMSPAAMQRAVAGLAADGHATVTHRFARSNVYTLAEPFRRRPPRPAPIPASECQLPENDKPEGEALKGSKKQIEPKEGTIPVRRAAPPLRPAGGRNPFARQPWLRKLSAYAGERLSGSQRMFAWEVIAKAEAGGLAGEEQRALDRIDREMRACGFRPST